MWDVRMAGAVLVIAASWWLADRDLLAADSKSDATAELQGGEKVLSATDSPLGNPLRRKEPHPWFELSNLRRATGFLNDAIEIDYAYEGDLKGLRVVLIVVSDKDRYRYQVSPFGTLQRTGSFRTDKIESTNSERTSKGIKFGFEIEAYVIVEELPPEIVAPSSPQATVPLSFKVSKSLKTGKDDSITLAREWRPKERETIEYWEKRRRPPAEPPQDHVFGTQVALFVPGTPVMASLEGEWKAAEILWWRADRKMLVRWNHIDNFTGILSHDSIAVSKDTVARLEKTPESFKPSVVYLVGGMTPLPKDAEPVTTKTKLVPGTPLLMEGSREWTEAFVIKVVDADTLQFGQPYGRFTGFTPFHEHTRPRSNFAILKTTLAELEKPNAVEKFAASLKEREAKRSQAIEQSNAQHNAALANHQEIQLKYARTIRSPRTYVINALLPEGTVRVTESTPLEPNIKCQMLWGRSWSQVSVLEVLKDRVLIRWDEYGQTIEPVTRDSLVIKESALKELTAKAKSGKTDATKTDPDQPKTTTDSKSNPTDDQEPPKTAKGVRTLVLVDGGKKRIPVAKVVMEITGFDLAEAKEILDSTPIVLKKRLTADEAEKWQKALEKAGAQVKVEE